MTTITSNIDTINIDCIWCLLYVVIISVPVVITKKKKKKKVKSVTTKTYCQNDSRSFQLTPQKTRSFFFFLGHQKYVSSKVQSFRHHASILRKSIHHSIPATVKRKTNTKCLQNSISQVGKLRTLDPNIKGISDNFTSF